MSDKLQTGLDFSRGSPKYKFRKLNDIYNERSPKSRLQNLRESRKKRTRWNSRFSIAYSKDNGSHHKLMREYFDLQRSINYEDIILPVSKYQQSPTTRRKKLRISRISANLEREWERVYNPLSEKNSVVYSKRKQFFS